MTSPTDDELMGRVRVGDQEAFAALYARHRRPVFTFLFLLTRSRPAAEDLLQETFFRVWRSRAAYRASGAFRSWVATIARRLCVDRARREGRAWIDDSDALDSLAAPDAPDRHAEARDELARVRRALDALPPAQREVVLLARLLGIGPAEIARVTGATPGAVRVALHRALAKLRERLEEA